jgi:integrase/recombinase XerD
MKLTAILAPDRAKDGTYPIVIRISHKGERKLHYTGFRCLKDHFQDGRVTRQHKDYKLVNSTIESLLHQGNQVIAQAVINGKSFSVNDLFREQKSYYFGAFIERLRPHYLKKGSYTMYRKSSRFKIELEECFDGDICFDNLDQEKLRRLENHMIDRGNTANTRHKKFKFYSSFFNKAIQEGLTISRNPFMIYEIKTEKTYKEKLTKQEIQLLEEAELKGRYNDVRNLALFSYYCKGMRFENCVTARWAQIKGERIYFQLVKSNKPLSVKVHKKLQSILDQYPVDNYIFPFIKTELKGVERTKQLDSINTLVNRYLKEIIQELGIKKKISFHNFRHAVAYNMKKKGLSTDEIKDHLGHSRVTVTEQYLESLDDEHLDDTLKDFYE